MRAQHKHADGLIAELLCCVADHEEVALGLGHFLIVDGQEAVVQPIMRKGAAVCTLGLCDLVLVMRENQIKTAGMDVDGLAEVLVRHSRALNMPARAALAAPRRIPSRLTRLCSLPDREVHRIFLYLADRDAGTGLQLLHRLVAQLAILGEGLGAEVYVTVLSNVSVAVLDQALNNVDDRVHGLGRTRVHGRLLDAQTLCINKVFLNITLGDGIEVHAFLVRLVDYLIVNVSEVLHELNLVAAVLEVTAQQIENDERTCVADMEVVVHSRTAGIHLYLARRDRNEFLLLTGQRVVEFHDFYLLLMVFRKAMRSFGNKKASQGIFFPREACKRGSTPIFRSCSAVTGTSRKAFDPVARQAHFTVSRAKPFQPRSLSLSRKASRLLFLRHRINNDYNGSIITIL